MYFWDKHKTITTYYELLSGEVCDRYGLTQMEYDILMFLHNNPQYNTAAEIVKIRKSTKSHVSTSLKNLESKGLVERIQSKDNKKHIEIALLDQAEIIIEECNQFVERVDPQKRYLTSRRYITKAKFDTYFSIRTPVQQYTERQNILKNVQWEEYNHIQTAFDKLREI